MTITESKRKNLSDERKQELSERDEQERVARKLKADKLRRERAYQKWVESNRPYREYQALIRTLTKKKRKRKKKSTL